METALSSALAATVAQAPTLPPQDGSPRMYAVRRNPQSCHEDSLPMPRTTEGQSLSARPIDHVTGRGKGNFLYLFSRKSIEREGTVRVRVSLAYPVSDSASFASSSVQAENIAAGKELTS
eukprot:COSAG06_NODE_2021_length_7833_cov_3.800233_8_plen_120_part_00